MIKEQELRISVLIRLNKQPVDDRVGVSQLSKVLSVSQQQIIEAVEWLKGQGYVAVSALTSSVMLCWITTLGKQVIREFEETNSGEIPPGPSVGESGTGLAEKYSRFSLQLGNFARQPEDMAHGQHMFEQIRGVLDNPTDKKIAFLILDYNQQDAEYSVHLGVLIDSISCVVPVGN